MSKAKKIILVSSSAIIIAILIALITLGALFTKTNSYFEKSARFTFDDSGASVPLPSERQVLHAQKEYYAFFHFGMNTFTNSEWGTGEEDPALFTLKKADTDQWVKSIKDAGMTAAIMVAKHHDGFALWPSDLAPFSLKNTGYDGNVVLDVYRSCKKFGIKFGFYISPWDMNFLKANPNPTSESYNEFYMGQLKEINAFLSAEPGYDPNDVFEVWFDGAISDEYKGIISYDWENITKLVREYWPQACTAIAPYDRDVAWVGNEDGMANGNSSSNKNYNGNQHNLKGKYFAKSECDVSIRDGWFYHENEKPKSLKELLKIYYNSVGKNCTLLLNIPPNKEGKIDDKDVARLLELKKAIDAIYEKTVMEDKSTTVFKDGKWYLDYSFEKQNVKNIVISEDFAKTGERIEELVVYVKRAGLWEQVGKTNVVGAKWIFKVNGKTDGVRIVVKKSNGTPSINYVGIFG